VNRTVIGALLVAGLAAAGALPVVAGAVAAPPAAAGAVVAAPAAAAGLAG
jgi:hypothetical protein